MLNGPEESKFHDPQSYFVSEPAYITFRNRILNIEGQILNAIGFEMHVALPYPLAVTYLQALDIFGSSQPRGMGVAVAKRTVEYLNTALLSPQMLYLTHQPNTLATASIYLAARDLGAKLPGNEWWEVFDTDREDLGFLALGMKSLAGWIKNELRAWHRKGVMTRNDVKRELVKKGGLQESDDEREEKELMRIMDEKVL